MQKAKQTHEEIIRKAAPVFHQNGYAGAVLSDLMAAKVVRSQGFGARPMVHDRRTEDEFLPPGLAGSAQD